MLHIHNGDSTAGTLREFGLPGEHKAFREALMEGPAPAGLSTDEWVEVRAGFLADGYEFKIEDCARDLRDQEAWLREIPEHEETILWFEHDLFCQINLIYLLDWFSKQRRGSGRLSLVCVGEFPGVKDFRGLGQLTGKQLASLFDKRHDVTEPELKLAARAWASYCSADPGEIQRLIEDDTSVMRFLGQALRLHLARFPSMRNGLGRVENSALEIISSGAIGFKQLFPKFADSEPGYGLGDSQFWCVLRRLGGARNQLIRIAMPAEAGGTSGPNAYHDASFELTETGRAVLSGERDFIHLNGIDLRLGGVHLVDGTVWRWDEGAGLIRRSHH